MASNFKIFIHRNDDNLHLRLMGDFDGSSAFELINALKAHTKEPDKLWLTLVAFLHSILLDWVCSKKIVR